MLFARAWEHLDADPDKTRLFAWYIYNAYIDLTSSKVSESLAPDDPRFLVLAEEFLQDEKAAKSLFRSPTYLRFRAQQGGWSESHAHASRTTLAYKQAEKLIGREFKVYRDRSDQKQPVKSAKRIRMHSCGRASIPLNGYPAEGMGGVSWLTLVSRSLTLP